MHLNFSASTVIFQYKNINTVTLLKPLGIIEKISDEKMAEIFQIQYDSHIFRNIFLLITMVLSLFSLASSTKFIPINLKDS